MRERGIDPGRGGKALWARAKELVWRDSKIHHCFFPVRTRSERVGGENLQEQGCEFPSIFFGRQVAQFPAIAMTNIHVIGFQKL